MKRFCILLLSFFIYNISNSKYVYVSKNGNDEYEGNIYSPFLSIERAIRETNADTDSLVIILREGNYIQNKSLVISGKRNIILTSYPNEKVYITGGITIDRSNLSKIEAKEISSRVSKSIRKNIRCINFHDLGFVISDLNKRGFEYRTSPLWNEIFVNDEPLNIAQWPNDSMIVTHKVINPGNNKSKGIIGKGNPVIEYIEREPNTWKTVEGGWICGYFGVGWADDMLPMKSIDKLKKTITVGSSSLYGFRADGACLRWFARNLPEFIDMPGEYVNDVSNNLIYFLPPPSKMEKIQISVLKEPLISIKSSENITIRNIIIECSRGTGIQIESSNKILVDSCVIRNMGNMAVKIGGDTYDNGVQNTYIYNTGAGGIELNGGNRKQLISGNNFVYNCIIHNFNRIEKAKRPAIYLKGAGNKVLKVEICDAPSMAIYIYGNNHTIEYANIHHVCKEMHDCGAIYYGRNPTERGHIIRYSYLHDIQSPFALTGIYHDDGACGMQVFGCIFNNISSAPVLIGGGQDITYTNNLFMNLPYAIQIDNRLQVWQSYSKWLQPNGEYDNKFKEVDYTQPPYSEVYPELLEYWLTDPAIPKRNVIKNNIFYNVENLVKGKSEFLEYDNNLITDLNPCFVDITNPLKGFDDVLLKKNMPEFIAIPVDKIGCNLKLLHNLNRK